MSVRAWVPYADIVPELPESLTVDVYDGHEPVPASIDEVELYVMPFVFRPGPLELIGQMPRLRLVQTLTAGYEHVFPHLPRGVRLCNAPGVHDASTAEMAMALILASLRGIPDFVRGQDSQQWRHSRRDALADRTVLIVGYGGIGVALERRLDGFEVNILRVARHARDGVQTLDELPALLPTADVVVLAVPLTKETEGMVGAEFLARMREGALLVNVARGGVVQTDALVAELRKGRIRAALDVTDPEPLPPGHPLWSVERLLLSPHNAGNSTAFEPRAKRLIVAQLGRYVRDEPLLGEVTRGFRGDHPAAPPPRR